jgi:VanZ family protein
MTSRIFGNRWTAILWTAMIFVLLVIPGRSLPEEGMLGQWHLDKLVHAALFGGFTFLWFEVYRQAKPRSSSQLFKAAILLFLAGAFYGTGMEFYQKYFTSREFETGDIIADSTGAAIAAIWCMKAKK